MWTILHVPALNIPGFAGEDGCPIGLTAVGGRYTDEHLLHVSEAVGEVFEKEGGWVSKVLRYGDIEERGGRGERASRPNSVQHRVQGAKTVMRTERRTGPTQQQDSM